MKAKRLRITIDLDLTVLGTVAIERDKSRFQKMAEDLAAHFDREPTMVRGTEVNIEVRDR